jgi:hypothetical protein
VVLTKTDLLHEGDSPPEVEAPDAWGLFAVSAVARKGLGPLLDGLWARIREEMDRMGDEPDEEEGWWVPEEG